MSRDLASIFQTGFSTEAMSVFRCFFLQLPDLQKIEEFPTRFGSFQTPLLFYCLFCPSLPKSPKYLVSRCLEPLKAFSGGVCGSKHLLTRYLED